MLPFFFWGCAKHLIVPIAFPPYLKCQNTHKLTQLGAEIKSSGRRYGS